MEYTDERYYPKRRSGTGVGWFWLGATLGLVISATAVVIANEFRYIRKRHLSDGFDLDDCDIVEDLGEAVHEGLHVLVGAAGTLSATFKEAASERIRFGLEPGGGGAGSHAWYTGEEE